MEFNEVFEEVATVKFAVAAIALLGRLAGGKGTTVADDIKTALKYGDEFVNAAVEKWKK